MSDSISLQRLKQNLSAVRERIAEAADRAGRPIGNVTLIAVTKYAGINEIKGLASLGVTDFGESRIQDAGRKKVALSSSSDHTLQTHWHLIGHLQTNKADLAVKLFQMVHSVDSVRVAQAMHAQASKAGLSLKGLLQVNVAGETSKHGLPPNLADIAEVLKRGAEFSTVQISGLMTMAPHAENPENSSRSVFKRLRELRDELNALRVQPVPLTELSMGMTQDYQIAVEEGATLVRVGTALFETD